MPGGGLPMREEVQLRNWGEKVWAWAVGHPERPLRGIKNHRSNIKRNPEARQHWNW